MIKKIILFCCLFTFASVSGADFMVKAGMNYSRFATEDGSSQITPAGGIGWQFPLNAKKRVNLEVDLLYVGEKILLENCTWRESHIEDYPCKIGSADFSLHYDYLKLPLTLSYQFIKMNAITSYLTIGYSTNFSIVNRSDADNYSFVTSENCIFDYERANTASNPKHPDEMLIGVSFLRKKVGIDLVYSFTTSKTKRLVDLKIQDHIHSFRTSLFWKITFQTANNHIERG